MPRKNSRQKTDKKIVFSKAPGEVIIKEEKPPALFRTVGNFRSNGDFLNIRLNTPDRESEYYIVLNGDIEKVFSDNFTVANIYRLKSRFDSSGEKCGNARASKSNKALIILFDETERKIVLNKSVIDRVLENTHLIGSVLQVFENGN